MTDPREPDLGPDADAVIPAPPTPPDRPRRGRRQLEPRTRRLVVALPLVIALLAGALVLWSRAEPARHGNWCSRATTEAGRVLRASDGSVRVQYNLETQVDAVLDLAYVANIDQLIDGAPADLRPQLIAADKTLDSYRADRATALDQGNEPPAPPQQLPRDAPELPRHVREGVHLTRPGQEGAMAEQDHQQQTRSAYDLVAEDYARLGDGWLAASPWERAILTVFAETVIADGGGPVLDAGCGTGRLTGHLAALGLDVSGMDLSPGMLAVARRTHPGRSFEIGDLFALPFEPGELAGVAAWYSVIHTPPDEQPAIYRELARVLRPGGHLLMGFQVGADECAHLEHAYGHDLSLDAYRLDPDRVATDIEDAGWHIMASVVRDPIPPEPQQQAYLLARKSAPPAR